MNSKKTKALFIGGSGHSGTTMMYRIFSKHKDALAIPGESRVFESFNILEKEYNLIRDEEQKIKYLENNAFYGVNFKRKKYQYNNAGINLLKGNLTKEKLKNTFSLDYEQLIFESLGKLNLKFMVEKTPSNVYHTKEISKTFSEFKLIIIHRDVRDVITSLKKRYIALLEEPERYAKNLEIKKLDKDYNLVLDAVMWNKLVKESFKVKEIFGEDQIKIISYEEFVKNSKFITIELCNWLNINFDENMLDLVNRNSAYKINFRSTGINDFSVGKFKEQLNPSEIAVIEKYAKNGMNLLGLKKVTRKTSQWSILKLELISFIKIFDRIRKRLLLLNPKHALNFAKRFVGKFLN